MTDPLGHPALEPDAPQPDPDAPAPDAEPAAEPTEPDAEPELLAGKYKTAEDLVDAYKHSDAEIQRLQNEQRMSQERERLLLERLPTATPSEPTDPYAAEREALEAAGLDANAIQALTTLAEAAAAAKAPETVDSMLSPLLNNAAAREGLSLEERGFADQALESDQQFKERYNQALSLDPGFARGMLEDRVKLAQLTQAAVNEDAKIKAEREGKRTDATVPARRTSQNLNPKQPAEEAEARRKALLELGAQVRDGGDPNDFAQEALRGLEIIDENGRRKLT